VRSLLVLVAVAACQGQGRERAAPRDDAAPAAPAAHDASVDAAVTDWTARCEATLLGAPKQTPVRRLNAILAGCQPCGDWKPLLAWMTPASAGGPSSATIEDAMAACQAYCSGDARQKFLGTLDDGRDKQSPRPWRILGEVCGAAVSAVPDARFMSAPYFALDRIARAAAANARLLPLLAAIELPLPALSPNGIGFELPASAAMQPDPGRYHVSVTSTGSSVGELPRARLGADGVTIAHGATPYPGEPVEDRALAAALAKLPAGERVAVLAPRALPAARLVEVVARAGRDLHLAVAAGGPPGWTLPGVSPVVLAAPGVKPTRDVTTWDLTDVDARIAEIQAKPALAGAQVIRIDAKATVADLAKLLGAFAYKDVKAVTLERAGRDRSQTRPTRP